MAWNKRGRLSLFNHIPKNHCSINLCNKSQQDVYEQSCHCERWRGWALPARSKWIQFCRVTAHAALSSWDVSDLRVEPHCASAQSPKYTEEEDEVQPERSLFRITALHVTFPSVSCDSVCIGLTLFVFCDDTWCRENYEDLRQHGFVWSVLSLFAQLSLVQHNLRKRRKRPISHRPNVTTST